MKYGRMLKKEKEKRVANDTRRRNRVFFRPSSARGFSSGFLKAPLFFISFSFSFLTTRAITVNQMQICRA